MYKRALRNTPQTQNMARRTKDDSPTTRDLLDAAEYLFLSQGVSRTSLQHVARRAGATRRAVYWHFTDKADLVTAMIERVTLPLEAAFFDDCRPTSELVVDHCGCFGGDTLGDGRGAKPNCQ